MSARNTISQVFLRRTYFSPKTRASQLAPRALTLIEMLIGMAITLVMMAAVVNLFANIGAGVSFRRAGMEMNSQLRVARARLYKDLAGATCEARPKLPSDDHNDGYIELVEGIYSDMNPSILLNGNTSDGELVYTSSLVPSGGDPQIVIDGDTTDSYVRNPSNNDVTNGGGLGDYDDILALTTRSQSDPFTGRGLIKNPTTNTYTVDNAIKSDLAEVIWYAVENPADGSLGEPGMRTVYRRALLIAPWIGPINPNLLANPMTDPADPNEFFRRFDVSARYNSTSGLWIPNTLSDLVKRENRFAHEAFTFPHAFDLTDIRFLGTSGPLHPLGEPFDNPGSNDPERDGEDVMINNVLAFDLRVYDPGAPQYMDAGVILEPSDTGWVQAYITNVDETADGYFNNMSGQGTFVDLGYVEVIGIAPIPPNPLPPDPQPTRPIFDMVPHIKSLLDYSGAATASVAYDTWSFHYENDGIDQDNDGLVDQGTNGLDDDGINGVDDIGERETSPPYNVPLRGLQVKIRTYEPDSRQIKEVTVTRNLVPN